MKSLDNGAFLLFNRVFVELGKLTKLEKIF